MSVDGTWEAILDASLYNADQSKVEAGLKTLGFFQNEVDAARAYDAAFRGTLVEGHHRADQRLSPLWPPPDAPARATRRFDDEMVRGYAFWKSQFEVISSIIGLVFSEFAFQPVKKYIYLVAARFLRPIFSQFKMSSTFFLQSIIIQMH